MRKKDREVLELRQKTLDLNDRLNYISQMSWRIRKAKERYSFDSDDIAELESLHKELSIIYENFIGYCLEEIENKGGVR